MDRSFRWAADEEEKLAVAALCLDGFPAETRVSRECRRVQEKQRPCRRNGTGEAIVGEIELCERGQVEWRDTPGETIELYPESIQAGEIKDDGRRDLAGERIAGEVESAEAAEEEEREREVAGERVLVEEESFEVGQRGEVADGPREGVVFEAEETKLGEERESGVREEAAERESFEDQVGDAPLAENGGALHAGPVAVSEGVRGGIEVEAGVWVDR